MARTNPFAYVDYAPNPGMPRGNESPPQAPPQPDLPLPPHPILSDNPTDNARQMQQYVDRLNATLQLVDKSVMDPTTGQAWIDQLGGLDPRQKEVIDQAQKELNFWLTQSQLQAGKGLDRQDKLDAEQAAIERAKISAGATMGAAGISAGASAFSATEATRRQGQQQEWQTGESALSREFTGGENALNRAGTIENTTLSNKLGGEREAAQRDFEGQQNALDRQIRNVQNQIAQGELGLKEGLGILEKYLQAQPYTLPTGAEYVPGFQPGGAVQEASRLAGVGYNPANYKAKTVAFDPQALVRQTMGR